MPTLRLPLAVAADVSDAELLARFRRGDDTAFAVLVRRHAATVRAACRVHQLPECDADDVFQNAFLELVRQAERVTDRVGGWLYRVAERGAKRLRRRRRGSPLSDELPAAVREPFPDAEAVMDEVSRLPEKYRQAVAHCYLAGKTTAAAAAELGWAKGTVLTRLAWARKRLHDRLSRRGVALSLGVAAVSGRLVAATVSAARRALDAPPAAVFPLFNTWKEAMTTRNVLVAAGLTLAVAVGLWTNAPAGAESPKPPKPTAEVPKAAAEKPKWVGTWVRETTLTLHDDVTAALRLVLEVKEDTLSLAWECLCSDGRHGGGEVSAEYATHRGKQFFGKLMRVTGWEMKAGKLVTDSALDEVSVVADQPFAAPFAFDGDALVIQNMAALGHNVRNILKEQKLANSERFLTSPLGRYVRTDPAKPLPPLKLAEPPTDAEVLKALKAKPDRKFVEFRDDVTIVKNRVRVKGEDGQAKTERWECAVYLTIPSDPPGREIKKVEVVYIEK